MSHWYTPERDGTPETYVLDCFKKQIPPSFKGLEQYLSLYERELIIPFDSTIRFMHNDIGDESYQVIGEGYLRGILCNIHDGNPGVYSPQELFTEEKPYFEAEIPYLVIELLKE
jgi:hypothetical protein